MVLITSKMVPTTYAKTTTPMIAMNTQSVQSSAVSGLRLAVKLHMDEIPQKSTRM